MIRLILIMLITTTISAYANSDLLYKKQSLATLREQLATTRYRDSVRTSTEKLTFDELKNLLDADGSFKDLTEEENNIRLIKYPVTQQDIDYTRNYDWSEENLEQSKITNFCFKTLNRLWTLAENFRKSKQDDDELKERIFKGIIRYGTLENERVNLVRGRWTQSAFGIPVAAINIYFCFYPDMQNAENKSDSNQLLNDTNSILQKLALQAWEIPLRLDNTDNNIVSIERFRHSVFWEGGNAITYRPAMQSAILLNSIPMMEVIAEVNKKALQTTSIKTAKNDFWEEAFTSDGLAWGHGRQMYIWGYPLCGVQGALDNLAMLKGTPWGWDKLPKETTDILINFLRGSSFFIYKGFVAPVSGRHNVSPAGNTVKAKSQRGLQTVKKLKQNWFDSFSKEQQAELNQYVQEEPEFNLFMLNYPEGTYHGSRYFYDNDDMVHKNPNYQIIINMASNRVDGVESYYDGADGFNYFCADGATFFQRNGDEYIKALGAFELSLYPGVTTRKLANETIKPINNWQGYSSTFDFAAGATNGKDFVSGFIYRKFNGATRPTSTDPSGLDDTPQVYGVLAYKSYFLFGNTFLALGAGITNEKSEFEGNIVTTLDQTLVSKDSQKVGDWEKNNNFFYKVLEEYTTGKVISSREKRKTHWQKLSQANSKAKENEIEIFQMFIDHGMDVKNGTYAYIVECSGEIPQKLPEILANTTQIQAAKSADGKFVGAVFFDSKATLQVNNLEIKVDQPCAVLVNLKTSQIIAKSADGLNSDVKTTIRNLPQ